ncbi:hypothetical protein [Nocardia xishanensis]|uniref:Uncharacterized protein n=1 Tax=Nocardia xishanensis TaxID=238964 RepID=A0ABW7WYI6_9NOCA
MKAISNLLWDEVPSVVHRYWLSLGMVLGDGEYVRAWPPVAVSAPFASLGFGAALAVSLSTLAGAPLYTYSFAIVTAMLVVSGLGAALGLWVWLGFVLTDLVVGDHATLPGLQSKYSPDPLDDFARGYLPLGLAYGLLFGLLVVAPLLARVFALGAEVTVHRRVELELTRAAGSFVYVVALAGLAYVWAQAVPFMIRPIWSFSGSVPAATAIQPIQSNASGLATAAALSGVVRAVLTRLATPRLPTSHAALQSRSGTSVVGQLVAIPIQALILTMLLSGMVFSIFVGLFLWLAICVLLLVRVFAVPHIPWYADHVRKVPLLLRIATCALVAYYLTKAVVEPAIARREQSFASLVSVLLVALAVATFLLPGPHLAHDSPGTHLRAESRGIAQQWPDTSPPPPTGPVYFSYIRQLASIVTRFAIVAALASSVVMFTPSRAPADNCGDLSDCPYNVKVALVAAAIALVLLVVVLLPQLIASAAAAEAAMAEWTTAMAASNAMRMMSMTSAQIGRYIIGWGETQTAAAVAQTRAVTQSLTTEIVRGMIARGLTREWVEAQLATYGRSFAKEGMKLVNKQLVPRIELMRRILELWP